MSGVILLGNFLTALGQCPFEIYKLMLESIGMQAFAKSPSLGVTTIQK
jgi:hypothetical protein